MTISYSNIYCKISTYCDLRADIWYRVFLYKKTHFNEIKKNLQVPYKMLTNNTSLFSIFYVETKRIIVCRVSNLKNITLVCHIFLEQLKLWMIDVFWTSIVFIYFEHNVSIGKFLQSSEHIPEDRLISFDVESRVSIQTSQ